MFKKAGYTDPPKTLSELAAMAKKLTVRNPDGSLKVVGFDPLSNFYEGYNLYVGNAWGAQWYDANGKSAFGTDPAWQDAWNWDKQLTDWYGYDNLTKFLASVGGPNSEWNAQNAFEAGRVAMLYDGEWRESFIQNDKAKINYATAPFPVADDHPELYGSGLIGGTVVGIPSTGTHPAESWLLVKYLTTNTEALTTLAHLLKNVPTTYESLKDPQLNSDPIFKPFLDIFQNPNSHFRELTTLGVGDANLEQQYLEKWEAGSVNTDLQSYLNQLASQIDKQMQLG
jgi:multiple sugar transport system substrate-binding protein